MYFIVWIKLQLLKKIIQLTTREQILFVFELNCIVFRLIKHQLVYSFQFLNKNLYFDIFLLIILLLKIY